MGWKSAASILPLSVVWKPTGQDGSRDNGKGTAVIDLPHVCNLFAQSSTTAPAKRSGLGIGLAVIKRIVELHGGTFHITSTGVGMGTTATVRLPLP
ncbi:MAG TPA: ATP-binding protein [Paraburkholderia sp.]|uniref:ATP-binding protein n=1 Tax=Paraburkholderia sp. TaxID=1926495 RepID=UPI002B464865|nr:ATP-binding protein [Paraburkholderia sp.]HKR46595.1 ATP-binding protein [Paraburkholderia sp.]